MLISVTGTPGVGKTTLCNRLSGSGWKILDLKGMITTHSLFESRIGETRELLVDRERLRGFLERERYGQAEDFVLDGHMSYLAPSEICLVLRLRPDELKRRLMKREYPPDKVRENVEAEAVSVILVEALEIEEERLDGVDWKKLPAGSGIVMEIDTTGKNPDEMVDIVKGITEAYRGKMLNELSEYRPGRIDWLEVNDLWY